MELEVATAAPADAAPVSESVLELRQVANEAKQQLKSESASIEQQPRKGGRPPGARDKKPRAAYGSKKSGTRLEVVTESPASVPDLGPETSQVSMLPAIEQAVKVPFDIFANKSGCELVRVSSDEAKPPALAIDQALQLYFPDAMAKNPKEMALISLAIAVGGLALTKYQAYTEWVKEKTLVQNQQHVTETNPTGLAAETSPAPVGGERPALHQDYFRPRHANV